MTATHLDGLVVIKDEGKETTCYDHWMILVPKFAA